MFLVIEDLAILIKKINISDLVISKFFNFITRILRVKRSLVLQDLTSEFLAGDIMTCELKVIMVDGHGKDEIGEHLKGIYRDGLSSFWQEFYVSCTLGERGRVPSIRHDFQSDHWTALGVLSSKVTKI